jgi:hypothetical protein
MLKWLFRRREPLPQSADECFRLGTELAQRAQLEAAIALLRRAIELEPAAREAAAKDEDFDAIRDDPEFPA